MDARRGAPSRVVASTSRGGKNGTCHLQDTSSQELAGATWSGPSSCEGLAAPPIEACYRQNKSRSPTSMQSQGRSLESSPNACQHRCALVHGCMHFSWWQDGGCQLQDSSAREVAGALRSGPATCAGKEAPPPPPTNYIYKHIGLCMTGWLSTFQVHNIDHCSKACRDVVSCGFFAYEYSKRQCLLSKRRKGQGHGLGKRRKVLAEAKHGVPGLMSALKVWPSQPFKGLKSEGSLHVTSRPEGSWNAGPPAKSSAPRPTSSGSRKGWHLDPVT